jgi:hypothetical protein
VADLREGLVSKRWKRHELETARRLGTERNPSNGRRQNDIDAGPWAIEHKSTKRPQAFIRKAMHQAVEGAKKRGEGQTPIVIICAGVGHELERYVVMRFGDFEAWHGKAGE